MNMLTDDCSLVDDHVWVYSGPPPQIFLIGFVQIPRVAMETSEGGCKLPNLSPVASPVTRYQTLCVLRHVRLTIFGEKWKLKLFFSQFTGVYSALEALRLCSIFIHSLFAHKT